MSLLASFSSLRKTVEAVGREIATARNENRQHYRALDGRHDMLDRQLRSLAARVSELGLAEQPPPVDEKPAKPAAKKPAAKKKPQPKKAVKK